MASYLVIPDLCSTYQTGITAIMELAECLIRNVLTKFKLNAFSGGAVRLSATLNMMVCKRRLMQLAIYGLK